MWEIDDSDGGGVGIQEEVKFIEITMDETVLGKENKVGEEGGVHGFGMVEFVDIRKWHRPNKGHNNSMSTRINGIRHRESMCL